MPISRSVQFVAPWAVLTVDNFVLRYHERHRLGVSAFFHFFLRATGKRNETSRAELRLAGAGGSGNTSGGVGLVAPSVVQSLDFFNRCTYCSILSIVMCLPAGALQQCWIAWWDKYEAPRAQTSTLCVIGRVECIACSNEPGGSYGQSSYGQSRRELWPELFWANFKALNPVPLQLGVGKRNNTTTCQRLVLRVTLIFTHW